MKKRRISKTEWAELRVAYASGLGLRELARNAGIAEGTVLARSHREKWTHRNHEAKALATVPQSNAINVADSAALSMAQRGQRHVTKMAGVVERVVPYVEAMRADAVLGRIDEIEKLDKVARRTFGIAEPGGGAPLVSFTLHAGCPMPELAINE